MPRLPEHVDGRNRYWCETCGALRMSGGKVTGAFGHVYLLELRELVQQHEISVPDPGHDRGRKVVLALGATIAR